MKEDEQRQPTICPLCSYLEWMVQSPVGRHLLRARREVLRAVRAGLDRQIGRLDQVLTDEPEVHSVEVE